MMGRIITWLIEKAIGPVDMSSLEDAIEEYERGLK